MPKSTFRQVQESLVNERAKKQDQIGIGAKYPDTWVEFANLLRVPLDGKLVYYEPFDFQIDLINAIESGNSIVVLKSRQTGISLTLCSWAAYKIVKHQAFKILIFSKTQRDSSELSRRIKALLSTLPDPPKLDIDSASKLKVFGGSEVNFLATSINAARGFDGVSALIYDECEFIRNAEELHAAASPSTATVKDSKVIYCSTPKTKTSFFYVNVQEARLAKPGWKLLEIPYTIYPIFANDPDFKEKTKEKYKLTEAQFLTEYALSTEASAYNLFDSDQIDFLATQDKQGYAEEGKLYIAACDTSYKKYGDNFVIVIAELEQGMPVRTVDWYVNNELPFDKRMEEGLKVLKMYNPFKLNVETNGGLGDIVIDKYRNELSYTVIESFNTTNSNKKIITDRLAYEIEIANVLLANDDKCKDDFKFFEDKEGKREAPFGHNDDWVMVYALLYAILIQEEEQPQEEVSMLSAEDILTDYYE